MNDEMEAISVMAKEILKTIKVMIDKATFDRTRKCRVVNHIQGKYYNIQLDGNVYKAYSPYTVCEENDIVYVKIIENNYNNLLIECVIK